MSGEKKRRAPGRPFVMMSHELIDCPAFVSASCGATRLLIFIWRRHNGRNNGAISCSIREAAAFLHCGKSTAARYFSELHALGLIEPVRLGNFVYKVGDLKNAATTWRLSFLPNNEAHQDDG
jgi:hypothetical protein